MILDSNVVIDLIDPDTSEMLGRKIASFQARHRIAVNEIIFAEIAAPYRNADEVATLFGRLGIFIERLTLAECHRAGVAFAEYRRRGGDRQAILADFLIGAQAEVRGWPLVTRDRKGFASYFPKLEIIDPMDLDD